MNEIQKLKNMKLTENGDVSYKTTGKELQDLFFLTAYYEKHLDEVKIGTSDKEKLLAMYIRDCRYGLGRRDLGRVLMEKANVSPSDVVLAGRYDDLWHIGRDEDIGYLKKEVCTCNELAKKWMPRRRGKDKIIAKIIRDMWGLTPKQYNKLIKTSTTEYKLSYAEKVKASELDKLFNKGNYIHPLVDEIEFEKVPSLAMKKYLHCFSTREDIKDRFNQYMQDVKENKKKINVSTTNIVDGRDVALGDWTTQNVKENQEILANKIVDNATIGVEMDAIVILDTSGSMGSQYNNHSLLGKAMAIAHGISTHSTYAKNQLISFSSNPKLMTIKGDTLEKQYDSMYTGDCSNTDFGKVMKLLTQLNKFPEYFIVISDMEFDYGSNQSKTKAMEIIRSYGAKTRIIWWNLNDRNKTVPEFDEYGNIFLSGYNLQLLKLLENKFNMEEYLDKILKDYAKKIGKDIDFIEVI